MLTAVFHYIRLITYIIILWEQMSASLIGKSSVTDISVAMSRGINRYMELVLEDIVLKFPCIDKLHLFQIHLVIVVNLVIRNTCHVYQRQWCSWHVLY